MPPEEEGVRSKPPPLLLSKLLPVESLKPPSPLPSTLLLLEEDAASCNPLPPSKRPPPEVEESCKPPLLPFNELLPVEDEVDNGVLVLEDRRPLAVVGSLNPPISGVVEVDDGLPNSSPPEGSLRPPAAPAERDNPPPTKVAPSASTVVATGLLPGFLPPHATHVREVSLLLTQQSLQVHEEEGLLEVEGPELFEEPGPGLLVHGKVGPELCKVEPSLLEEKRPEAGLLEEAGLFPGLPVPQATQEDELSLLLTQQPSQVHDDEDKVVD